MAIRNIQRVVVCLAVVATLAAVYCGRPGKTASPTLLAARASRRWEENRPAAGRWFKRLPPSATSARALLTLLASADESMCPSAVAALHGIFDQRRANPDVANREFVPEMAAALAEVSRTSALPVAVVDEIALRLLSWSAEPGIDGQRVAQDCAVALQAAGAVR